jgi:pimeloyl-ACP methyl ester carboxylesterase
MPGQTLRQRDISVAGVRSPVLEGGPDGPEAVVFVHGNPGSGRDWTALATAVSELARVVAPDMPGFGRADKPAHFEHTVERYARHLAGVLNGCGVQRAHLVLHDFGGPWGLTWAAANPEAFRSVVLIDTGVLPGYHWHVFARIWQTPLLGEAFQVGTSRWLFQTLIRASNPRLPREFLDGLYDDYDGGTRRAVLRLYRATPDLGALTGALAPRLRPLERPALVIWGARDSYLGAEYAERQREVFPAAEVAVLENSGHWPHADAPGRVRDLLTAFLRARIAPPTSA